MRCPAPRLEIGGNHEHLLAPTQYRSCATGRLPCIPERIISVRTGPLTAPTEMTNDRQPPGALRRLRPSRLPRRDVHRPRLPQARRLHRARLRGLPRPGRPARRSSPGRSSWPSSSAASPSWPASTVASSRLRCCRSLLGALFVHAPNGWVFNAPNGGWEYPAFLAAAAFAHALIGDGAFAAKSIQIPGLAADQRIARA